MKTTNLIQASANVLKITSLNIGDVVKQVDVGSYSSDIYFCVVTDLLNDGENCFIQLTRYKNSYDTVEADIKIFKGGTDLQIFPTTVDEVKNGLNEAIGRLEEKIKKEERDLYNKKEGLRKAIEFVSLESSKKLSECSYKEISQIEYDNMKKQKEIELNKKYEDVPF